MEELIGRRVKLTLNNMQGLYIVTGEVLRVDAQFLMIKTISEELYISLASIKTIELHKE
jgi:RNase P/RNase MRP subunit p29